MPTKDYSSTKSDTADIITACSCNIYSKMWLKFLILLPTQIMKYSEIIACCINLSGAATTGIDSQCHSML